MAGNSFGILLQYLEALLGVSSKLAWTAANGLIGGLLLGGVMIFHGVLQVVHGTGAVVDTLNWCLSFLVYATGVWGTLFVGSLIFVSPYRVWRDERDARLRAESDIS